MHGRIDRGLRLTRLDFCYQIRGSTVIAMAQLYIGNTLYRFNRIFGTSGNIRVCEEIKIVLKIAECVNLQLTFGEVCFLYICAKPVKSLTL